MLIAGTAAISLATSCAAKRQAAPAPDATTGATGATVAAAEEPTELTGAFRGPVRDSKPVAARAMTQIYRTNGDYDNLVPITLNAERNAVVSYPAPSDLTEFSTPVKLDDGFLMDRRGVGLNTAFIRYTYAEYRALKSAPTPAQLLEAVIPDARVTEVIATDIPVGTPDAPQLCNKFLKSRTVQIQR